MNVFDALIFNDDRNPGNVLVDDEWKLWMIDHTRAFQSDPSIRNPEKLWRIDRDLWTALNELTSQRVAAVLGPYLERSQINALMARRDAIVEHFRRRIEDSSAEEVFYDLEGWLSSRPDAQVHDARAQVAARLPGSF